MLNSEATRRRYRRESLYNRPLSVMVKSDMLNALTELADKHDASISTVCRAAIDAGLPIVAGVQTNAQAR